MDANTALTSSHATTVSSHATLHNQHTAALAAKQPLLNTTDLYHDSSANRIAIGTATPSSKFHVCYTSAAHKGVYFGQGADLVPFQV